MKIKTSNLIITLIILFSICTNLTGPVLFAVQTSVECSYVYNRGFQITAFMIAAVMLFLIYFLTGNTIKINSLKNPIGWLLFASLFASVLQPEFDLKSALIGVLTLLIYWMLYVYLDNRFTGETLKEGIYKAFRIIVPFELAVGFLSSFLGISIPYITGDRGATNIQVRNGILRMSGTFAHAGDFSLYMTVCMILFLSNYFLNKKRSDLIFVFMSYFMIYCSGARATLLIATASLVLVYIFKHKNRSAIIFMAIPVILGGIIVFAQSAMFDSLISADSEEGSIWLRISFWLYGLNIVFSNPFNFLFGAGLNNQVAYAYANFGELYRMLPSWLNTNYTTLYYTYPIHNAFISMWAELGTVGLLCYLGFFVPPIKKAFAEIRAKKTSVDNLFVFVSLASIIIYGMQGWAVLKSPFWVLLVIIHLFSKKCLNGKDSDLRLEPERSTALIAS